MALADYGRTPSAAAPQAAQRPSMEGCSTAAAVVKETAQDGQEAEVRESQGRRDAGEALVIADEAPVIADEASVDTDPAASPTPKKPEKEEGEDIVSVTAGSSPMLQSLTDAVGRDISPVVVEKVREAEVDPAAVAFAQREGKTVESPGKEPAGSLLAGSPEAPMVNIKNGKQNTTNAGRKSEAFGLAARPPRSRSRRRSIVPGTALPFPPSLSPPPPPSSPGSSSPFLGAGFCDEETRDKHACRWYFWYETATANIDRNTVIFGGF